MQVRADEHKVDASGHRERRRIPVARLVWATALSGLVAVAGTAALFAIGSVAGLVDGQVVLPSPVGTGPLSLAAVAVAAAVAVIGAGIVLGVLGVATRRPVRTFRVGATALAVLSLAGPATVAGAPAPMRLLLVVMHLVVWAVCVCLLPWLASRTR